MQSLRKLLEEQLKDIYSAENQVSKALPKLAKASSSEDLAKAFRDHLEETKEQITRLNKIGKLMNFDLKGEKCEAAEGLIEEGESMIEEHQPGPTLDAGLIAAAQRFEHYEIAAYGTVRAFAEELGLREVAQLLQETLDQEGETNKRLTKLAHQGINRQAALSKDSGPADMDSMTKDELYELAQQREIAGRSEMTKKELIAALK